LLLSTLKILLVVFYVVNGLLLSKYSQISRHGVTQLPLVTVK
jgi:hypothetical protein